MSEPILGKDFILFLKEHGYINDDNVKSISINAPYDDVVHISVEKVMHLDDSKCKEVK